MRRVVGLVLRLARLGGGGFWFNAWAWNPCQPSSLRQRKSATIAMYRISSFRRSGPYCHELPQIRIENR
jgi:hypothetical protein